MDRAKLDGFKLLQLLALVLFAGCALPVCPATLRPQLALLFIH